MKKILVIEDSADVRSLISDTLRVNGYQAIVAEDGATGLELARSNLPDLILCDVNMPRLNGYATLSALREQAPTATIPFIFLTGAAEKEQMRHGMELGADDYLTKPFTLAELLAAVRARLEKHAAVARQSEKKLEELRGNIRMALPHELITPLNGIIGFSSLLVDNYSSLQPAEILEFGRHIQDSAGRLQRLVENFLVYSQIELVAADPEKVAMLRRADPAPTRDRVEKAVRQAATKVGRNGEVSLELIEARLALSPDKLQKIVTELVENALKFSPPGSGVRVMTRREDHVFVLAVEDHGRGITAEQVAKIGAHMQFERKFYEQQGSGLGLVIVRRLVELYGGQLHIESVPGVKTTVKVLLPLAASLDEMIGLGAH